MAGASKEERARVRVHFARLSVKVRACHRPSFLCKMKRNEIWPADEFRARLQATLSLATLTCTGRQLIDETCPPLIKFLFGDFLKSIFIISF